jgi:hypothetical protein
MKKRKFMIVSQNPYNTNEYVKLATYNFEIVKDYTYLGTLLTNNNELRPEVEKGITNANRAYYAESWMWNKGIAKRLATFERKVLKRISGGMEVN